MHKLKTMPPSARTAILQAAADHGVDAVLLAAPSRRTKIVRARLAAARALDALGYSSPRIGHFLNHDHSTILFYLGKLKKKPTRMLLSPKVEEIRKPRWRRPRIGHLRCKGCFRCRVAQPAQSRVIRRNYLQPYAGADFADDYKWTPINEERAA